MANNNARIADVKNNIEGLEQMKKDIDIRNKKSSTNEINRLKRMLKRLESKEN